MAARFFLGFAKNKQHIKLLLILAAFHVLFFLLFVVFLLLNLAPSAPRRLGFSLNFGIPNTATQKTSTKKDPQKKRKRNKFF